MCIRKRSIFFIICGLILLFSKTQLHAQQTSSDITQALKHINYDALDRYLTHQKKNNTIPFSQITEYQKLLSNHKSQHEHYVKSLKANKKDRLDEIRALISLQREILLTNPALDFKDLIYIDRSGQNLGLPSNFQSNSRIRKTGYSNTIKLLKNWKSTTPQEEVLFKPKHDAYVGELDLHFDTDKMLISMPVSDTGNWEVFELDLNSSALRQVTEMEKGVNAYDACYLPDNRILFTSTAPKVSVPCVTGSTPVTALFLLDEQNESVRQLTFDQEHCWHPTILPNGRVLYTRWEYSDLPHSNSRILFHANPDGTGQKALYGSNSYWPNSFFYTRPIPGNSNKLMGIVTGHHGAHRQGELVLFDITQGTHEADGAVQKIPGYGKKVEATVKDELVKDVFPVFLHPFPLDEQTALVSGKMHDGGEWGLYLVDVFDNILLLKELSGRALFEPIPLKKQPSPPIIPDKVKLTDSMATVYIQDIYFGPGLKGIPKGEVDSIRLFTYTYSYNGVGGLFGVIGLDGPWDMKRVIGTVPVNKDGSAMFKVPANTPIGIQPLDKSGKAMQLMRSWFVGMPGEVVSCIGCHEEGHTIPLNRPSLASRQTPQPIQAYRGAPTRGFAFEREIQPILDKRCVGCHNGTADRPDLRKGIPITDWKVEIGGQGGRDGGQFSQAYAQLFRYVRTPGIESDLHLLTPMEFHASTSELVQMLHKGHKGVRLDDEEWNRLCTWIDMNAPYHGEWSSIVTCDKACQLEDERSKFRKKYSGVDENHEKITDLASDVYSGRPIIPSQTPEKIKKVKLSAWPLSDIEAKNAQKKAGEKEWHIEIAEGVKLIMTRIPKGEFIMGSATGHNDERPMTAQKVEHDFWIGKFEITNEQMRAISPSHNSRRESRHGYQFGMLGFQANADHQPAVRISWQEAMDFCKQLSEKTGISFTLPTEAQWEYACRAGKDTPFSFGENAENFQFYANLGDRQLRNFAEDNQTTYWSDEQLTRWDNSRAKKAVFTTDGAHGWVFKLNNPSNYVAKIPREDEVDDGGFISREVGQYAPNVWGLHDMHGNVWEWTLSDYQPYPYRSNDGRNEANTTTEKVARGGSWYDRAFRATASFRLPYQPYQPVYNVGFRVVVNKVD